MSIVKSLAVGNGDMFYIRHNVDRFTVIDCCLPADRKDEILDEIADQRTGKGIHRFISTHPDGDHLSSLTEYQDRLGIVNLYVVKNEATKSEESDDLKRYKSLRDDTEKAFYLKQGCKRKWLNQSDETRGGAGISVHWPKLNNEHFKDVLQQAKDGESPNNISPIIRYSLSDGASVMWMGDLETDFMEKIKNDIIPKASDILFAPHHGRKTGRVPKAWLDEIDPTIIVVGEAPSVHLTYYNEWDTITQKLGRRHRFRMPERQDTRLRVQIDVFR